jgi:hypothetical protein
MRRLLALALVLSVTTGVISLVPATPAGAATITSQALLDTVDAAGDGSGRLLASWVEVQQEPFLKRLVIARTQAGSSALDASFGSGGRRTITLDLPTGWYWQTDEMDGKLANIEATGFDPDGNVVVVWFAYPRFCPIGDWCVHSSDRMMIDRYSPAGARLSRSAEFALPDGAWCGEYFGYEETCNPTADNSPQVFVLDNGAVALRTYPQANPLGANGVRFFSSGGGALFTLALGSKKPGSIWARGATGAVVNEAGGTYSATAVTAWSSSSALPSASFCSTTGSATTSATLRTCFAAVGSSQVTRFDGAGTQAWQRTISYGALDAAVDGGSDVALKITRPDAPTIARFSGTGTVADASLGGATSASYEAPIPLGGTKVGIVRYDGPTESLDLLVSDLASDVPATVPGKPARPTAVPGPTRATVSWTAPGDGGSPITGYRITPYKAGVAQTPIDVGVLTSKEITALTNGTAYRFTIAARNAVGLGPASDLSDAVTPATVPGAPTSVVATAGKTNATVTWTPPASNGGSPITGYKVQVIDNGVPLQIIPVGNVTSWVVPDLFRNNVYTFRVSAVNAIGTGPPSATSNPIVLPPAGLPTWPAAASRQFQDLLGRPPTAAETATWVPQLQSGAKTLGELPAALRTSTDHVNNVDPVTRLYSAYLGRVPDRGGLTYWINKKRGGTQLTAISSNFATSNEFKTKYGTLTNRAFVELVYENVLGRSGDPSGITFWTRKLDTRTANRGQVMVGFSESSEYKRKQAERVTAIVLITFLLGRAPTSAEVTSVAAALKTDTTVAELADQIFDSDAYANRIASLP